jgi:GT2 family glycosyltransferase
VSRLSIVIPWRENTAAFETTLVSVLANRPFDSEVIVVHRGVYEDPYELRREVLFVEHDDDASLADLLNRGLEVASGEVLHLIACGIVVDDAWSDGVREVFAEYETLGALTPVVVQADSPHLIVNSGVTLTMSGRRKLLGAGRNVSRPVVGGLGPSRLAGFYRLSAVRDLGGFSNEVGELVDVDLAGSLVQAGYETSTAPECQLAYAASAEDKSIESDIVHQVRHAERVYWRQRAVLGRLNLPAHMIHGLGSSLASLINGRGVAPLQSRIAAAMEWSSYREHRRQVDEAALSWHEESSVETISLDDERQRRTSRQDRRAA